MPRERKITAKMKLEFWKNNLNPITGWERVSSLPRKNCIETFSVPKLDNNSFKVTHG